MSQYKVLGQVNPTTTGVLTNLYTVPVNTQAFCSTLSICNQGPGTSAVTIAVLPAGGAVSNASYILYNQVIMPNDSIFLTVGLALNQTDVVSVLANTPNISFNLFGTQI